MPAALPVAVHRLDAPVVLRNQICVALCHACAPTLLPRLEMPVTGLPQSHATQVPGTGGLPAKRRKELPGLLVKRRLDSGGKERPSAMDEALYWPQ